VAFWPAKPETFTVISDEHHAMSWVARPGAEKAVFDTHFNT